MTVTRVTVRVDIPAADRLTAEAVERGVRAATSEAKRQTIEMLSQQGKGRAYKRGKTKTHIASRPGDPPAPDTGRLRNSTQSEVFRTGDGAIGIVSVNTEYARALELGTEKIAPRPFLARTLTEGRDRILQAFARFSRVS
jgi:HK97 gp10 family phage protein